MTGNGVPADDVVLEIDCRGMLCPLPVRETAAALEAVGPAEVVRVRCTDPVARLDLGSFCARAGHELCHWEERSDELVLWIRKRASS